ncbi:MAG: hypothetical protein ACLFTU_06715, partial [Puniceicoccaceae bacterium]
EPFLPVHRPAHEMVKGFRSFTEFEARSSSFVFYSHDSSLADSQENTIQISTRKGYFISLVSQTRSQRQANFRPGKDIFDLGRIFFPRAADLRQNVLNGCGTSGWRYPGV